MVFVLYNCLAFELEIKMFMVTCIYDDKYIFLPVYNKIAEESYLKE